MIKQTLQFSIRNVFHNSKFVLLIWFINAASAVVLTVPIFNVLYDNLNHSLMSDRLTEQFDFFWYLQIRTIYAVQFDQLPVSIYAVIAIYTLIQTFFVGGLIAIFNTPKKNHIVDFFYGGVKYFFRFLKVLLVAALLLGGAFILNDYLGDLITYFYHDSENVMAEFIFKAVRYLVLIFLIGVVILFSDYSKIVLAVMDKTKFFSGFYESAIFVKNNFVKVFTVFLLISIIGALGVLVYNIIGKFIPRTPAYFLILSFILQQMLIIFRLFIRMLYFSAGVILFKDLNADLIHIEEQ